METRLRGGCANLSPVLYVLRYEEQSLVRVAPYCFLSSSHEKLHKVCKCLIHPNHDSEEIWSSNLTSVYMIALTVVLQQIPSETSWSSLTQRCDSFFSALDVSRTRRLRLPIYPKQKGVFGRIRSRDSLPKLYTQLTVLVDSLYEYILYM